MQVDLAIIGAGGSGLVAAVRAAELGLKKIALFEKAHRPGGNAWLAVVMLGVDTNSAPPSMVRDLMDEGFRTTMLNGEWLLDPVLVRRFFNKLPEVCCWLREKGLSLVTGGFELGGKLYQILRLPQRSAEYRRKDPSIGPGFVGSTVVKLMIEQLKAYEVPIYTRSRVKRIIREGKRVTGVVVEKDEEEINVRAKAVLISAGGFGYNLEMLRTFFPDHFPSSGLKLKILCTRFSTGDGIKMAKEIGAALGHDMDPGIVGPGHHPWSYSLHELLLRPECIWVNKEGKRFCDESISFAATKLIARQPEGIIYGIVDSDTLDFIRSHPNQRQIAMGNERCFETLIEDFQKETRTGWKAKIAHSFTELARFIGANVTTLEDTIKRYNQYCEVGRDLEFGKPKEFLWPCRKPPLLCRTRHQILSRDNRRH